MGLWGSIKNRVKKLFTVPGTSAANSAAQLTQTAQQKQNALFEEWRAQRQQWGSGYDAMNNSVNGLTADMLLHYNDVLPTSAAGTRLDQITTGMTRPKQFTPAEQALNAETARIANLNYYPQTAAQKSAAATGLEDITAEMIADYGKTETAPDAYQTSAETLALLRNNPDPAEVQRIIEQAYGTVGKLDTSAAGNAAAAKLKGDAARRGLKGSGFYAADVAGLENWKTKENARLSAEGKVAGVNAGNTAREQQRTGIVTAESLARQGNEDVYSRFTNERGYVDKQKADTRAFLTGERSYADSRKEYEDLQKQKQLDYLRGERAYKDEQDAELRTYLQEERAYADNKAAYGDQKKLTTYQILTAERDRLQNLADLFPVLSMQGNLTAQQVELQKMYQDQLAANRASIMNALTGLGTAAAQWFKKTPKEDK